MPKLTKSAGIEWGTGFYINPTPPVSREFLREARVETPLPLATRKPCTRPQGTSKTEVVIDSYDRFETLF